MSYESTASMSTILNERFFGVPIETDALPVLDETSLVLDVGSGIADSKVLTALLERSDGDPRVVRVDAFADALSQNPGSGRVVGSATALPIGNRAVHAVVTSELTPDNPHFEAVVKINPNQKKLMSEIARVVRLGGHWIAYNESISTLQEDSRPPGFATTYLLHDRVKIAPNYMSLSLPFGVYEKVAEPIDPVLIGEKVARWPLKYADNYTRALDENYPVSQIVGNELIAALKDGDTSALDQSAYPFLLYFPDSLKRKFFIKSALVGAWVPEVLPFDHAEPEERLAKLGEPYGNELTRSIGKSTATVDGYLRSVLQSDDFYAKAIGRKVVIVPRQELLDKFIDFRDTTITKDDVHVQMSNTLRDKKA